VLFAGWFGPRGLASIVLGPIVIEEALRLPGDDEIELVVASTVLLSVLLHGITATLFSAAYARRIEKIGATASKKKGAVKLPTRIGAAPTSEEKLRT
jgi:sodium/hydrogen antiporter